MTTQSTIRGYAIQGRDTEQTKIAATILLKLKLVVCGYFTVGFGKRVDVQLLAKNTFVDIAFMDAGISS